MLGFLRTFLRRLFLERDRPMLQVGSQAPAFEAADHRGKTHKLSDYRGKRLVLYFYPKADTPG
jgi:peroxiredoxin Q/BCP